MEFRRCVDKKGLKKSKENISHCRPFYPGHYFKGNITSGYFLIAGSFSNACHIYFEFTYGQGYIKTGPGRGT